jgi:AcrR family transcriptional regulator
MTSRAYHHGDLRNALIDAALTIIAEGNVADVSLREVARRAGVTYAAPYHHFADKSALLAAVACQGFERFAEKLEEAAHRRRTLKAELLSMSQAYVAFAAEHPYHYRVMFLPDVKQSSEADALRAAADRAFGLLQARVARARPGDSESRQRGVAIATWAALHGLSLLVIDGTLAQKSRALETTIRTACRSIVGMVFQP